METLITGQNQISPTIQAIDKRSVHQICSGQVVLDLATAVKELVENSLDAGASSVEIKLKEHGKEVIEVNDNGVGIEERDFEALALKYYTSKLKEFSDLTFVDTFGFRGEALSSLSALSDLSVTTQHSGMEVGSKLDFDHSGTLIKRTPVAREQGTSVSVSNLFYTLPVRYKEFHRNFKKEFIKLVHVLYSYSLINSDVRFNCVNQASKKKHVILSTNGKKNVVDIVTSIFGSSQGKNIVSIKQNELMETVLEEYNLSKALCEEQQRNLFNISGYISKVTHGCGRSSPDRQFFFINNRPCDFPKIARVVNEVYHMFNQHQYPFVFLDVSLNREFVDVNVTPDKRQIMIHQEKLLLALIKSSLKAMFESCATYYEENVNKTITTQPVSQQLDVFSPQNDPVVSPLITRNKLDSADYSMSDEDNADHSMNKSKEFHLPCINTKMIGLSPLESFRSKFDKTTATESDKEKSLQEQPKLEKFFSASKKRKLDNEDFNNKERKKITVHIQMDTTSSTESTLNEENRSRYCDQVSNIKANTAEDESSIGSTSHNGSCNTEHVNADAADTKMKISNHSIYSQEAEVEKSSRNGIMVNTDANEDEECYVIDSIDGSHERERVIANFDFAKLKNHINKYISKNNIIDHCMSEVSSFRAKISPSENQAAEEELNKHVSKESFSKMEILGQFNLGFIIAKLGNDLFIVDQHATDEKYNFETLQQKQYLKGQRLIQPIPLELTLVNENILLENIDIFKNNGFDFEVAESNEQCERKNRIHLLTVPSSRNWTFSVSDVEELIFMLSDSPGVMCRPSRVRQMFASRACRTSVMVGTALDKQAMKRLVTHMGEIDHPWNCPHGRPTMRHMINLERITLK